MNYTVQDAANPRFPKDFELVFTGTGAQLPADAAYLQTLRTVIGKIIEEAAADPQGAAPASQSLREERAKIRADIVAALRTDAQDFAKGTVDAEFAAFHSIVLLGRHNSAVDRLAGTLFRTGLKMDVEKRYAVDVDITVTKGRAPPEDTPSPPQQALFTDITAALTIVRTVYRGAFEKVDPVVLSAADQQRLRLKLDKYVRDLQGIADVGLKDNFVDMASRALASLKAEFVSMEAPRIKNDYLWNLGRWSAGFAVLAVGVALLSVWLVPANLKSWGWTFVDLHGLYPFAVASVGAAIGTWLSFSLRKVTLTFEQLAAPEEDMLHPPFRVLVVLGLTLAAMLIFYTGVINLEIGSLKTTSFASVGDKAEAIMLLVGMFCGIGERGLSSAVVSRANDFVSSIGGARKAG